MKKYLKITLAIFITTFILGAASVNAKATLGFSDITIPSFGLVWLSDNYEKDTWTIQSVLKSDCWDTVSWDGRVIDAKAHATWTENNSSDWVQTVKGSYVRFNDKSAKPGSWKLYLKSRKSLPTTAKFWGAWEYNKAE